MRFLSSYPHTPTNCGGAKGIVHEPCSLRLDAGRLGLEGGLTSGAGGRCGLLAGLADVALTETLGDDDALLADGGLAFVALHQGLAVHFALFTNGSTAVFLAAAVADHTRAAIVKKRDGCQLRGYRVGVYNDGCGVAASFRKGASVWEINAD